MPSALRKDSLLRRSPFIGALCLKESVVNNGKAVLGIILLALGTGASIKIIFWGIPIEKEENLVKVVGVLSAHDCRKDRFIEAIKLEKDKTHYWLEQKPNLLPRCDFGKKDWPIGSSVVLFRTPAGFKSGIKVYELYINDKLIFNYSEAVKSIKSSSNMVIGFTAFMWLLVAYSAYKINKHNKRLW